MKARTIAYLGATATSTSWIFIPLLAKDLGASDLELGLLGMLYGLASFLTSYYFGRLSDNIGRRLILIIGLILASITFASQMLANSTISLIFLRMLCGAALGIYPPVLFGYVSDRKGRLGKFSSWQSLGWSTGTLIAGYFTYYWQIFTVSSLLFLIAAAVAFTIDEGSFKSLNVPRIPVDLIKKNAYIYTAYMFRHTGAQMVWVTFPVYLASIGVERSFIGVVFSVNSFIQFLVMQISDRVNSRLMMGLGFLFSTIAFTVLALSSVWWHILLGMMTIGVSWGSLYSGTVRFLAERNREVGTTTGMLQSAISFSAVLGPIIGGTIAQFFGYRAPIYMAVAMCAIGSLIFLFRIATLKGEAAGGGAIN